MAKLTEYAKCAVCQFCHYWWFSFLGPTARIGGYSRIFHWPPYVGGPMRTILPVSFSFDMYFFISFKIASIRVLPVVWYPYMKAS